MKNFSKTTFLFQYNVFLFYLKNVKWSKFEANALERWSLFTELQKQNSSGELAKFIFLKVFRKFQSNSNKTHIAYLSDEENVPEIIFEPILLVLESFNRVQWDVTSRWFVEEKLNYFVLFLIRILLIWWYN